MNLDFLVKLPEGEYVFPVDFCVSQKPNRDRYFYAAFYLYKTTNTHIKIIVNRELWNVKLL